MQKTPLHPAHEAAGAKMVDFGGWHMPIQYGSLIEEHKAVREKSGMFDVSHMTVVDLQGERVIEMMQRLIANDVAKLKSHGRALYTCMLNERGGIIDDLICYFMADDHFRLVVNAATRDKDIEWLGKQASQFEVDLSERSELAMIAVQGPSARAAAHAALAHHIGGGDIETLERLKRFAAVQVGDFFVARTGYTGEDGYEIVMPAELGQTFWTQLAEQEVQPCGLGARDTLRLEAGLNLYGQDMDETTSPYESNLGWTVSMKDEDRDFIGREALQRELDEGVQRQLVGLKLRDRGVMRHGQTVVTPHGEGTITSGTFSPTRGDSIAMARVPAQELESVEVQIRNKTMIADVVKIPFI